jgi:ubiquinone/menaquinone biosynthesis C-methylase UbiE
MTGAADAVRRSFDRRAATYDENAMHRGLARAVAEFVELEGIGTVLDVATGTGLVLRAIGGGADGPLLIGVDLSPGMLEVARAELPGARWLLGAAEALPVEDDSVDLVTCVTALHVIPDAAAVFAQWRRVLRPGGRVVTATFVQRGRAATQPARRPYPVDHAPFGSVETMRATASSHGFALRRSEEWADGADTLLLAELAPR